MATRKQLQGVVPEKSYGASQIYFTGAQLSLYRDNPPSLANAPVECEWEDGVTPPECANDVMKLATKALEDPLPSTDPDITLTLTTQLPRPTKRIPHVWKAKIEGSLPGGLSEGTEVVAKIYDPVYYGAANTTSPVDFVANMLLAEVEAYDQLKEFQGTGIPRYYGHYRAAILSQDRIAHVLLIEYIEAKDIRTLVGSDYGGDLLLCSEHKDAVLNSPMYLWASLVELSLEQQKFQPRNVLVYPPQREGPFCTKEECPVRNTVDRNDVRCVFINFEKLKIRDWKESPRKDDYTW